MTYQQLREIHLSPSDFERYEMSMEERIAFKVIRSLSDRGGYDDLWDSLPSKIKEEIFEEIRDIVSRGGRAK